MVEIEKELADALIQYLSTKPFAEVYKLISAIHAAQTKSKEPGGVG